MYNWSTNTKKFTSPEQKDIWELEQTVNFGLGRGRLNRVKLKKYWSRLNLDPARKRFLEYVLWHKQS